MFHVLTYIFVEFVTFKNSLEIDQGPKSSQIRINKAIYVKLPYRYTHTSIPGPVMILIGSRYFS